MARGAAARRYAKALFGLAREAGRVEAVRGELASFGELLEQSRGLHDVLARPLHPAAQRRRALDAVAERIGASELVRHFLAFLLDQRRLVDYEAIREAYEEHADEAAGVTRAEVRSASELDDAQQERLRRALAARTGREVELRLRVEPELLGGIVAQVGDLVFDGSLRTQLRQLHAALSHGQG